MVGFFIYVFSSIATIERLFRQLADTCTVGSSIELDKPTPGRLQQNHSFFSPLQGEGMVALHNLLSLAFISHPLVGGAT